MTHLDNLNKTYPIRKTDKEKLDFRRYILDSLAKKGIDARVERTEDFNNNNIIIGDPTTAKAVFTAHYDTPARSLFPNIIIPKNKLVFYLYQFVPITLLLAISLGLGYLAGFVFSDSMPIFLGVYLITYYAAFYLMMRAGKNQNNHNDNTSGVATVLSIIDGLSEDELRNVAFILFDNEEKGKKGSAAYFKDHKEKMKGKFLINFDCVGNGDNIIFIAQKDAVDSRKFEILKNSFKDSGDYKVDFCTYKEGNSNSDHKNFPKGVACVACEKTKRGLLYTPYIHTSKDIVANNENISIIAKNTCVFAKNIQPISCKIDN